MTVSKTSFNEVMFTSHYLSNLRFVILISPSLKVQMADYVVPSVQTAYLTTIKSVMLLWAYIAVYTRSLTGTLLGHHLWVLSVVLLPPKPIATLSLHECTTAIAPSFHVVVCIGVVVFFLV